MKKDIYLVAILPEEIKNQIHDYQKRLSEIYNIYQGEYPELHMTIVKLYYTDEIEIRKFSEKLNETIQGLKPIKINICGALCFDPPYKSVNFYVKSSPELIKLSECIKNIALDSGMSFEDSIKEWKYHISIANTAFADREWTKDEYEDACELITNEKFHNSFLIDKLELWYPVKKEHVICSFELE